ncbi:MAG: tRNA (adenosine(37)-N6)-dimethylallyltransferase MiaA [Legionellales bacterium]|nr:tRNA (adenosine(37)-N6)-dimethylallyltransferase MiaA [Legionellales bacterium]
MYSPLFCLMGPTASGKSALSYELANYFPVEVISIDSAMIYRGMNIGTAKPEPDILARIPHHLMDILDPPESTSVAAICAEVEHLVDDIRQRGKIPLLVGGTMMYFRALQEGLSTLPSSDLKVREHLSELAHAKGWDYMHQMLTKADPLTASKIHPHDAQRIQRALEVVQLTQTPLSEILARPRTVSKHHWIHLALMPTDRSWLHLRIAERFERMLAEGLIDEVEGLLKKWPLTLAHPAMRCVGYRQVMLYLSGEYGYATLVDKGVAATRQLAKRQLTWLRSWPKLLSFGAENPGSLGEIIEMIRGTVSRVDPF